MSPWRPPPPAQAAEGTGAVKNVVLVHGAFAGGSGWRGVYDDLSARGYKVTTVAEVIDTAAREAASARKG